MNWLTALGKSKTTPQVPRNGDNAPASGIEMSSNSTPNTDAVLDGDLRSFQETKQLAARISKQEDEIKLEDVRIFLPLLCPFSCTLNHPFYYVAARSRT